MSKGFLRCPLATARHPFGAVLVVAVVLTACAPKGEALYNRANEAMAKGDTRAAVIDLKNLVESEPQNAKAGHCWPWRWCAVGELQSRCDRTAEGQGTRRPGRPDHGASSVESCCRRVSSTRSSRSASRSWPPRVTRSKCRSRRVGALLGLERTEDAKAQFEAALAAQPDNLDARMGLAGATFKLDGSAAARAVLEGAPEVNEAAPDVLDGRRRNLHGGWRPRLRREIVRQGRGCCGQESRKLERLIAIGALAEAQIRAGKVKEATASSDKLLQAAPNNPLVKQLRGQIAIAGGDLEKARRCSTKPSRRCRITTRPGCCSAWCSCSRAT